MEFSFEEILMQRIRPRVVFTDRGPGFYQGSHGTTCHKYAEALAKHGFRPVAGDDASWQPPDIADLLLHESVAAGIRKHCRKKRIKWISGDQEANYKMFVQRLKEYEMHTNKRRMVKQRPCKNQVRILRLLASCRSIELDFDRH